MTAPPARRGIGLSMAMWKGTGWASSCARTVRPRNPLMTSPDKRGGAHPAYAVKK
jgi:hypothetical protein